jgi:hypothetical protein
MGQLWDRFHLGVFFQNPQSSTIKGRNPQSAMLYSPGAAALSPIGEFQIKEVRIMKRMATLISMIMLAALGATAQSASQTGHGQAGQDKPSKTEFFPVDQVKPGMRAVGYTVFSGSEPEKF